MSAHHTLSNARSTYPRRHRRDCMNIYIYIYKTNKLYFYRKKIFFFVLFPEECSSCNSNDKL